MTRPVYAPNRFDLWSRDEYLAYSKRSVAEVKAYDGPGKFRAAVLGDITLRNVMILVEWSSRQAFDSYCSDPAIDALHGHRVKGARAYIWHLFDKREDLGLIPQ